MSNALTSLVPVLDGTNYQEWAKAMQAYLMSMDLWEYSNGEETEPALSATPTDAERATHKIWKSFNQKALANLVLRINPTIREEVASLTKANDIWTHLKTHFDVIQPTTVFKDFKEAISIRIDASKHPLPQVNKLQAAVHRLSTNGVSIPEIIQAMILLSALPPKWEMLVSILCTSHDLANLKIKHVREAIMAQWETDRSKGKPQQTAQKLSAVKRKRGDPNFRQQRDAGSGGGSGSGGSNPQRSGQGQGNAKGKNKRGKRGGKKSQSQQGQETNDHSHLASKAAFPSPATASVAHLAPSGKTVRTVPGHTRHPPATVGPYATLNKARNVVCDIGVAGTSNTLKTLEQRITALDPDDSDDDQCVSKRSRSSPEPSDNEGGGNGFLSRSPTPDTQRQSAEDCVSLGNDDWDLDAMVCDAAGLNEFRSVPSLFLTPHTTHERLISQLAMKLKYSTVHGCVESINECAQSGAHGVDTAECVKCKRTRQDNTSAKWLLDSGASSHFTNSMKDFIDYEDIQTPIIVKTASKPIHIKGKGAVLIKHEVTHNGHTRQCTTRLYPVFYIPEITGRLLSVGEFLQQGLRVYGDAQSMVLRRGHSTLPLIQCVPTFPGHTIYWLESVIVDASANATVYAVDYTLMHKRFGHPSKDVLRHARSHTKGFPKDLDFPGEVPVCPGCAQGKMPSQAHLPSETRASAPFEKVHSDLKSFPVNSYHKYKYFVSFIDDFTSYAWIVCLRTKGAAIGALKHFIALVKNQFGTTVKEWMSDAGGEYKSEAFITTLKDNGIRILQSAPYTPKQNGRAERFMRTCMDKAQAMRLDACLPESWWEFAVLHAVHVYNRTPVRRLEWRTPYEALHGKIPQVSHLRVFGCAAYVHIPEERRVNKLSPKSELMVYIGHTEGIKAYTFMRLSKNTVYTGATALFDENMFPKCETTKKRGFTRLEEPVEQHGSPPKPTPFDGDDGDTPHRPPPSTPMEVSQGPDEGLAPPRQPEHTSPSPAPVPEQEDVPAATPQPQPLPRRSGRERRIPSRPGNVYGEDRHPVQQHRDVQRMRQWRDIVGDVPGRSQPPSTTRQRQVPGPSTGHPQRDDSPLTPLPSDVEVEDLLLAQLAQEGGVQFVNYLLAKAVPHDSHIMHTTSIREWTYKDILRLPEAQRKEWKTACREELEALRKRKVFELVDLPKGRKVIKNRWVFDQKTDGRKKARLVAKGFSQIEGTDFNEIFSPVVRFESVRLMLALAALEQWYITGLDVKSAFLYGELDEELYMEQPEGFKLKGQETKVLRLKRALYGLKQAALAWWRALDRSMGEIGCKRLLSDSGLFVHTSKGSTVVVIVYVDDALFMGSDKTLVDTLKDAFMHKWECRDLGEAKEFLRMRILKKDGKICIDQTAYLNKVLQRFGMTNAKYAATPLPEGYHPLLSTDTVDTTLRTQYQQIIGSLMYIMLGTRPDIAFAVTKMAQHAANPTQDHLNRALHICRYLAGTADYALTYSGHSNKGLFACADSDWASNPVDRRSTTGYMVKLADGIFSWNSRAQRTVALSSTEAEYMSLSDTSRQLVWIKALLSELDINMGPIPLCGDNQGSIFMASNPVQERRIKHIDIRYHYIREVVQQRQVELFFINGADNPADMFTKNLGRTKFTQFRGTLGLEIYSSQNALNTSTGVQSEGEC